MNKESMENKGSFQIVTDLRNNASVQEERIDPWKCYFCETTDNTTSSCRVCGESKEESDRQRRINEEEKRKVITPPPPEKKNGCGPAQETKEPRWTFKKKLLAIAAAALVGVVLLVVALSGGDNATTKTSVVPTATPTAKPAPVQTKAPTPQPTHRPTAKPTTTPRPTPAPTPVPAPVFSGYLDGDWSSSTYNIRGGQRGKAFELDEPLEDCVGLTMDFIMYEATGHPYGSWYLYVRSLHGHWSHVGEFEIEKGSMNEEITVKFDFDSPVTFDGLAVLSKVENEFNMSYALGFYNPRFK